MNAATTYPVSHALDAVSSTVGRLLPVAVYSPSFLVKIITVRWKIFALVANVRNLPKADSDALECLGEVLTQLRPLSTNLHPLINTSRICRLFLSRPLAEMDELIEDLAFVRDDELRGLVQGIAAAAKTACG